MTGYRTLCAAVVTVVLSSNAALAVTVLIPGKIGIVKSGKLAKMVAKDPAGIPFTLPAPSSATDPAINGATIRLLDTVVGFGTGGDVTINLPPGAAWRKLGNPPGSKGYKYKGAGTVSDPCKVVILKQKVMKAVCKSTPFPLTTPFDGAFGIRITTGTGLEYCAEFGGDTKKNDFVVLKRKDAPAPGACSVVLPTPTPTNTFTPTNTRTPTNTPTVTNTPTDTFTPTNTFTPTDTFTPTNTSTPTNTFTPSNTPTVTNTPTTTATPTATLPIHACTFNGAVDNSQLQICFLGVCPAASDISGEVSLYCDPLTQDVNGKRDCQCSLVNLDPFVISGVGTVCVTPSGPCPNGELDCDGGNSLSVDIIAETNAGACTSNAQCASQCGTYCSGIGKAVFSSGCESFCQGGSRNNLSCQCDTLGSSTCSGGSTLDCPGGSCEGKDNEADIDCHCQCVDEAFGGASAAGTISCRVGVAIRVEADPVCDNAQVLVRLPPLCAPFTSASATARILNTNEGATTLGPYTNSGTNESCTNFDADTTTGYSLVSNLAFFDSTIGDLIARLTTDCQ